MKHVVIKGLRLEYQEFPAARPARPALVLLHDGLGCVESWRDFPARLAARTGCRTLVGSRAGYGGSEAHENPRTRRYLHDEALEMLPPLLAAWEVERPVLVGHSDGANIALLHASGFPSVPAGVVAMAPHEFVEAKTLAGIRATCRLWETKDLRQRLGRYHSDPDRVFAEWSQTWLSPGFQDWNIEESLAAIRCPVLAIQGEDDEYASLRQIEVIAERVPGTELLKLPACRHTPHRDQPEAVLAAIAAFIDRIGPR
ncbi:MAG TPA: alpha/beta hydrolase [Myxococcales bacterium]|jgi:pimeloyl-ACP methyl ester carboxylesterase